MTAVCSLAPIVCLSEVTSTQDEARKILDEGRDDIIGVRADYQSAGRGRSGRVWTTPPCTCLLVTYIVKGRSALASNVGGLAFAAGAAVADAVEVMTGLSPGLKWPNDVMLGGRKVAGILVETAPSAPCGPTALVGIGLNVNVVAFPPDLAQVATSLRIETGSEFSVSVAEATVRERLFREIGLLESAGFMGLLGRWRQRDVTRGLRFECEMDGRRVRGEAIDVADTGALILRSDSGGPIEVTAASSLRAIP